MQTPRFIAVAALTLAAIAQHAAAVTYDLNALNTVVVNTSTGVVEYNVNMAAAMIAALPTLLVYILAGRYFVRGLMAGAVKG